MGNCIKTEELPDNIFRVRVVNDDKQSVQRGTLQVTETDLVCTNRKTTEQWQYQLGSLSTYGYDGDEFYFKCLGGEGVYVLQTQLASEVFNMVARNIVQGNLQPPRKTLKLPSEVSPPDYSVVTFSRHYVSEQPVTSSEILSGTLNRDSGAPKSDSPPSANVENCVSPEGADGETPSADELLREVPNELLEGKTANQNGPEGELPNEKAVEGETPDDKGGEVPDHIDEEKVELPSDKEIEWQTPVAKGTDDAVSANETSDIIVSSHKTEDGYTPTVKVTDSEPTQLSLVPSEPTRLSPLPSREAQTNPQ